jgi:trehalose 2-sulfotransferase
MNPSPYLVCATPRTGSTLICEMLRQSGRLGVPREYFEYLKDTGLPRQPAQYFMHSGDSNACSWMEELNLPPLRYCRRRLKEYRQHGYRRYLPRILRRGSTANGIFGAKIMWSHLPDFLELQTGDGSVASSLGVDAALRGLFPDLKYIYISRNSKLRQAVSLWIALQTQQWRLDESTRPSCAVPEPIFHFEAIDHLRRELMRQDVAWRGFFAAAGIAPLVLEYERFSLDLPQTLARVVDFLQIGDELLEGFVEPPLVKQADRRSETFVRMYQAGLSRRALDNRERNEAMCARRCY